MIALIPIIIVAHTLGNETPYFWLLIPPLAYYIIYPTAKMSNIVIFLGSIIFLIVTIMIISVIIIIPVVAPYVKEWHIAVASNQLSLMQMLSMRYPVFAVPSFVFFFFYHMLIIAEAKAVIAVGSSTVRGYDPSMERFDEISIGKYYELYDSIVEYFEKDKPYLDPSFSLAQLSIHFNSNNAYVSRAVKLKRNMSFTTFVNSYRIEKVKELIRNSRDVYTFEHIYTAAGFVNQSTFNKAFKQIEGVTPSEFAAR
jgi:AraC-like DNA-binding protein